MDKYLFDFLEMLSRKMDITAKIEFSTHRGWSVALYEKGYDMYMLKVESQQWIKVSAVMCKFIEKELFQENNKNIRGRYIKA